MGTWRLLPGRWTSFGRAAKGALSYHGPSNRDWATVDFFGDCVPIVADVGAGDDAAVPTTDASGADASADGNNAAGGRAGGQPYFAPTALLAWSATVVSTMLFLSASP